MKKHENALYNSYDRARSYLEAHLTELMLLNLFHAIYNRFTLNLSTLEVAILKQSKSYKYLAVNKTIYKKVMGNITISYCKRGYIQASILELSELAGSLKYPRSYITKAADKLALSRATDLRNILNENKEEITEITDIIIQEIDLAISKFANILNKPKSKIKERKSEGTEKLAPNFEKLKVDKNLIGTFLETYKPNLAPTWNNAIKIGANIGRRHTSLLYRFLDVNSGAPIYKLKCIISNGIETIEKYTTKQGWLRLYSLEIGTYDVTYEHPTYPSGTKTNIGIDSDHTAKAIIKLAKIHNLTIEQPNNITIQQ